MTIHLARAPTIDVPWVGAGGLPPRSRPAVGGRSLRAVGDLYRLPPVLPPEPNWSQRLRLEHARLATTTVRRHPTRRPWTRTGAQTAPSDRSCTTPAKGTPMHTQNKKKRVRAGRRGVCGTDRARGASDRKPLVDFAPLWATRVSTALLCAFELSVRCVITRGGCREAPSWQCGGKGVDQVATSAWPSVGGECRLAHVVHPLCGKSSL